MFFSSIKVIKESGFVSRSGVAAGAFLRWDGRGLVKEGSGIWVFVKPSVFHTYTLCVKGLPVKRKAGLSAELSSERSQADIEETFEEPESVRDKEGFIHVDLEGGGQSEGEYSEKPDLEEIELT